MEMQCTGQENEGQIIPGGIFVAWNVWLHLATGKQSDRKTTARTNCANLCEKLRENTRLTPLESDYSVPKKHKMMVIVIVNVLYLIYNNLCIMYGKKTA